jgi:hypothetical protein
MIRTGGFWVYRVQPGTIGRSRRSPNKRKRRQPQKPKGNTAADKQSPKVPKPGRGKGTPRAEEPDVARPKAKHTRRSGPRRKARSKTVGEVLADEDNLLEEWREMTVVLNGFSTAYVEASAQEKTRILWVPTTQLVKFVRETEGKHDLSYEHALGVWHQTKHLDVSIAPEVIGRTLDAVSANVKATYQRTGLGRVAVDSSTHMADLLDGRLRARLAMNLGITFFPIRVEYLPGGDRYRNIGHLALYQAMEVWREPPSMSVTARLRMVNVNGVPVILRKQWASVAQDCADIRLERVKKFKTGYWMNTWTLNDILVAFGVGVAFHPTLAADECVLAIQNSPLGALRCALVNNQGSRQSGQH